MFAAYGYRHIVTPEFEDTALFERGVGEATDIVRKEMYTFNDKGGRSLTLRPEGTAPICRAYVEHGMHKLPQPVKLWYYAPMFRYERPQAGRYREHYQLGAEAIGSADPLVDAEIIAMLAAALRGARRRRAAPGRQQHGRPGVPAGLRGTTARVPERAHEAELCGDCRERIAAQPAAHLRLQEGDVPGRARRGAAASSTICAPTARAHFDTCSRCCSAHRPATRSVDFRLVRGLDYYTRTTFEFSSERLGAQSGVGGGGRYDGLVEQIGGPPTPGVGFGTGLERISLVMARP